jgi:hypothetical protein
MHLGMHRTQFAQMLFHPWLSSITILPSGLTLGFPLFRNADLAGVVVQNHPENQMAPKKRMLKARADPSKSP